MHFTVFIPGYNIEDLIERCFKTVIQQQYDDFDVFLIDDCSTDLTGKIMDSFVEENSDRQVKVTHNETNMKMPWNLTYMREGNPNDVILIVDGDDLLPHDGVLTMLARHYEDPNLLLTYGSYTRIPDPSYMPNPALPYPPEIIQNRAFRGVRQFYNHPLTFRRSLWQRVQDWELQDNDGQWFRFAYDHIIMMPMLEMAARHYKYLPDILYVYNEDNPASEWKTVPHEIDVAQALVNSRPKRELLL